jgi:hypothetical protein
MPLCSRYAVGTYRDDAELAFSCPDRGNPFALRSLDPGGAGGRRGLRRVLRVWSPPGRSGLRVMSSAWT